MSVIFFRPVTSLTTGGNLISMKFPGLLLMLLLLHVFLVAVYKEEDMEMEIGSPTDVQHVTHIGWDDSTATTTTLDGLTPPPHFLSLPSPSLPPDSSVRVT